MLIKATTLLLLSLSALAAQAATITVNPEGMGGGSYSPSYLNNAGATGHELYIIGIYSDMSYDGFPDATVHVVNSGSMPFTLVLSAYDATAWQLDIDAGSNISQVIVNGYTASTVSGIDPSLVVNKSGSGNYLSACGYSIPYNGGGCNTDHLISQVESFTGLTTTAFAGIYEASDFTLTTSAVPVPAAAWSFGSALIALVGAKRKK